MARIPFYAAAPAPKKMTPEDMYNYFEFPTFKVPYEELNQTYRTSHKNVERTTAMLCNAASNLSSLMTTEGNEVVPAAPVSAAFGELRSRVSDVKEAVSKSTRRQLTIVRSMRHRLLRLRYEEAKPRDDLGRWHQNRERTNRLAIAYLLRCGRIETSHAFAAKCGMDGQVDWEVFAKVRLVEQHLLAHDATPCLEWIASHRSRLKRKIKSRLEQLVRVQVAIELMREGKRLEAIMYARKHLAIKDEADHCEDVMKMWALLGVGPTVSSDPLARLLLPDRWATLADVFREEFCALYKLPYQSAFSLCMQCGLAAFKTPACAPGANEKCITCQPAVFTLAEGLPHAHTGQSKLHCAYSGETINEDNPPWFLPSGFVYGEKSLKKLTQPDGYYVRCPRGNTSYPRSDCVRLYIL